MGVWHPKSPASLDEANIQANIPRPLLANGTVAPTNVDEIKNEIHGLDKSLNVNDEVEHASKSYFNPANHKDFNYSVSSNTSPGLRYGYQVQKLAQKFQNNEAKLKDVIDAAQNYVDANLAQRWKALDTYELIANNQLPLNQRDKAIDEAVNALQEAMPNGILQEKGTLNNPAYWIDAQPLYNDILSTEGVNKVIAFDRLMNLIHEHGGNVLSADLDFLAGPRVASTFSKLVTKRLDKLAGQNITSKALNIITKIPKAKL